jgi:HlyD family secretion protein
VSRDALDNARMHRKSPRPTNLEVIEKQYALTKAGAWIYDIQNQEKQYIALSKAYAAAAALLAKYTMRAPSDGIVRTVQATVGSYVSPTGRLRQLHAGNEPAHRDGRAGRSICRFALYVDEILIDRLADPAKLAGEMFIRGTDKHVPLTFVRVQPLVSPKIELSDERQERSMSASFR